MGKTLPSQCFTYANEFILAVSNLLYFATVR